MIAPESVLRLIPSTSSSSMSLPMLNNDDCVDASPAILERMSPLRLSEALISTMSQPLSRAIASATVVFPTPAGPYRRTAALDGLPLLFLARELDDENSMACGKCAICQGRPLLPDTYSIDLMQKAVQVQFLRRSDEPIEPRDGRAARLAGPLHLHLVPTGSLCPR